MQVSAWTKCQAKNSCKQYLWERQREASNTPTEGPCTQAWGMLVSLSELKIYERLTTSPESIDARKQTDSQLEQ